MQREKSVVSVIVPVYKVEKYLQKCIDSICAQSYPHLEIILVDDGSPDCCGCICDENAGTDMRIKVIHKENAGLSSARNAGLDIATGDYVAFVDADDFIYPEYVEILVGLCEQYGCDIAQCSFLTVAEGSIKLPLNSQGSLAFYTGKQALHNLCMGKDDVKYTVVWNKIYKLELFNGIRYPLGRLHEDEFTSYRLLWKARKVADTNQYLYNYLIRNESIIRSKYSVKRLDALDAFRERLDFLKANELEEEYVATVRGYIGLIERSCDSLRADVENCEELCASLLEERKKLIEQLPPSSAETLKLMQPKWTRENCPYQEDAEIVLYGAGTWGHIYYHWICENHWGKVVGWVDNLWNGLRQTEYPVMPLDSLLTISYDYVLITIESKVVQAEVIQNLRCWGIPEAKILTI